MRIIVAVKTNWGGTSMIPIVKDLIEHGDEVLCIVPNEEGHLERSLTDVGARTMRSATLGGSGLLGALRDLPSLVRTVRQFDPGHRLPPLPDCAGLWVFSLFVPNARRVHAVPGPLFLEQRLLRWIEHGVARRDSFIICTSGATRRLYRDRHPGHPDTTIAYPIDLGAWHDIARTRDCGRDRTWGSTRTRSSP